MFLILLFLAADTTLISYEAKKIISNAHEYIEQFKDKKQEDLISLLVLKKYFKYSTQL